MGRNMKQLSVSLDEQDLQALDDLSKATGHNISTLIREAIKRYLREEVKTRE